MFFSIVKVFGIKGYLGFKEYSAHFAHGRDSLPLYCTLHFMFGYRGRFLSGLAVYGGLFFIAFLAASIFPAQSEAVLAGLIAGGYPVFLLLAFATAGNVLGSVFNWFLGREAVRFSSRKWFPVKPETLLKAQNWYGRYGRWSLLLSWVPVIGDPLTLAAGVMRERLLFFVPIVFAAKLGRYIAVWLAVRGIAA